MELCSLLTEIIAIATLSALYVNFTQTLHKRSMAATSNEGSSLAAPGCLHRSPRSQHPLGLPRTLRRLKTIESQTYIAPRRQSAAVVDLGPFKPTSLVQDRITSIP